MLEKLREFDWSSVDHAYGPATDVPELIEALASGDADASKNAQWALFGNLWHQGTVYAATKHAVPFFLELLGPDSKADKGWILFYLSHLATGNSYLDVHQDLWPENERKDTEEFQAELAAELNEVKSATDAVREGIPTYVELLKDSDPDVRANAGYLFPVFRDEVDTYWDALLDAAQNDADPTARSSAQLACWCVYDDEKKQTLADFAHTQFEKEDTELGRWTIARLIAQLTPEKVTDDVLDALLAGLTSEPLDEQLQKSPWGQSNAAAITCQDLSRNGEFAHRFIGPMGDALSVSDGGSALEIAGAMLDMVFDFKPSEIESFDAMSDSQKQVLKTIAYSQTAWTFNVNMSDILRWFKLPDNANDLQAFCGLEPKKLGDDTFSAVGPGGHVVTATLSVDEEQ